MAEAPGSGRRSRYKAVGLPPWKEAFRQGCLERMRNSRDRLLNRYRQAGGNMPRRAQNPLLVQEVMEEEWNALRAGDSCPEALTQLEELLDLAVLEEIQRELADQEQRLLSEYEKSLQFDERCLSVMLAEWEANPLICPVCMRSNLRVSGGVVTCPCGLSLSSHSPGLTEQKLRACLEDSVNEHGAHCPHTPEFSVTDGTEEKPSLLMSCVHYHSDPLVRLSWMARSHTGLVFSLDVLGHVEEQVQGAVRTRPGEACDTWAVIL